MNLFYIKETIENLSNALASLVSKYFPDLL